MSPEGKTVPSTPVSASPPRIFREKSSDSQAQEVFCAPTGVLSDGTGQFGGRWPSRNLARSALWATGSPLQLWQERGCRAPCLCVLSEAGSWPLRRCSRKWDSCPGTPVRATGSREPVCPPDSWLIEGGEPRGNSEFLQEGLCCLSGNTYHFKCATGRHLGISHAHLYRKTVQAHRDFLPLCTCSLTACWAGAAMTWRVTFSDVGKGQTFRRSGCRAPEGWRRSGAPALKRPHWDGALSLGAPGPSVGVFVGGMPAPPGPAPKVRRRPPATAPSHPGSPSPSAWTHRGASDREACRMPTVGLVPWAPVVKTPLWVEISLACECLRRRAVSVMGRGLDEGAGAECVLSSP